MKAISTFLCLFMALTSFGQMSPRETRAEKRMLSFDYPEAITLLKAIDQETPSTLSKLAECYRLTGQYYDAIETYRRLETVDKLYPMELYYLASLERTQANYGESDKLMAKFLEVVEFDSRARRSLSKPNMHQTIKEAGVKATIEHLNINSEAQDFAPVSWNDKLIFASSRYEKGAVKRVYNRNNLPFLEMYASYKLEGGQLSEPLPFDAEFSGRFHEGPVSFNADGTYMVFTRNNYSGTDANGTRNLALMESHLSEKGWSKPVALGINHSSYNCGHAALNDAGDVMVFSSDMPGGFGGSDLYIMYRERGSWTRPMNLGQDVNTEGHEMFPFVHPDGLLFFASDGLPGLGGLDIFVSQLQDDAVGLPRNLGFPLNDTHDDFSFLLNDDGQTGYFSSNRPGGAGDDDLYSFNLSEVFKVQKTIEGNVTDTQGNILANADIRVTLPDGLFLELKTDELGRFMFDADNQSNYSIEAQESGFVPGDAAVNTLGDQLIVRADIMLEALPEMAVNCTIADATTGEPVQGVVIAMESLNDMPEFALITDANGKAYQDVDNTEIGDELNYRVTLAQEGYLTKVVTFKHTITESGILHLDELIDVSLSPVEVGVDLATIIEVNPIYFDLNKHNIRSDAATELDKIVAVLNENPTMVIELGSHTDCRGSDSYNKTLSARRAASSAAYIKARITNPERIYGKGFGETQPVMECDCSTKGNTGCDEDTHQQNRRTEFVIIKM